MHIIFSKIAVLYCIIGKSIPSNNQQTKIAYIADTIIAKC